MGETVPSPSAVEISARLAEVAAQRDMAQNRCIVLAGRNAELFDIIKTLQAELKLLKGEPDAADRADDLGAA